MTRYKRVTMAAAITMLGLAATSAVAANAMPADAPVATTTLNAVAAAGPDDVWAVGSSVSGSDHRTFAQHWDGSTWSVVPTVDPSGRQNAFEGLAVAGPDDVWAFGWYTGHTLVEHWDGVAWSLVPSPSPGNQTPALLAGTVVGVNDVWAVGTQWKYDEETGPETLTEHWNGTRWKVVATHDPDEFGENRLTAVSAASSDDIWAVGSANQDALVDHWDGRRWEAVDVGEPANAFDWLSGVAALGADDVWAVGSRFQSRRPLVLHFDGKKWRKTPTPVFPHGRVGSLYSVDAVAADDIWAVGESHDFHGPYPHHTLTMHWDGTAWSVVPSRGPIRHHGSILFSVTAIAADDAWAVGIWHDGVHYLPLVEHWDGVAWTRWTG